MTGKMFEDLEPWDEIYYSAMMKSSNYNLDSSVSHLALFASLFKWKNVGMALQEGVLKFQL